MQPQDSAQTPLGGLSVDHQYSFSPRPTFGCFMGNNAELFSIAFYPHLRVLLQQISSTVRGSLARGMSVVDKCKIECATK